jgi:hypothetical protein
MEVAEFLKKLTNWKQTHQQNQHNKDNLHKQESAHPLNLQRGVQNDLFLYMSSYPKDALYETMSSDSNVTTSSYRNV